MKKNATPQFDIDAVIARLSAVPETGPVESVETLERRRLVLDLDTRLEAQTLLDNERQQLAEAERVFTAAIANGRVGTDAHNELARARERVVDAERNLVMIAAAVDALTGSIARAREQAESEKAFRAAFAEAFETAAGPLFVGLEQLQGHVADLDKLILFAQSRRVLRDFGAGAGSLVPRDLRRQTMLDDLTAFERAAIAADKQFGTSIVENHMPDLRARMAGRKG